MKIIRPTTITSDKLTATSLDEDASPPWTSGTTYAKDTIATKAHRRWASLSAGNIGHDPEASPTFWVDAGPTTRWAMFDQSTGTLSVDEGEIAVTLAPGAIDALALVDLDAATARVTLKVGDATLYDRTLSTNAGGVAIDDWFTYFFEPIGRTTVLTYLDLPVFEAGSIEVTITADGPTTPASVGTLIVGRQMDLGLTEASPKVGITDFSRKVTDAFGVTDVVERAWAKRMSLRMLLDTSAVGAVQRTLASIRATPVLWVEEGYEPLTIYGFYKDFEIDLALETDSYCSLTVEGLT